MDALNVGDVVLGNAIYEDNFFVHLVDKDHIFDPKIAVITMVQEYYL